MTLRRLMIAVAAAMSVAALLGHGPVDAHSAKLPYAAPAAGPITLLSYNVEGLPWPITRGRATAAVEIADQLRAMRARGTGPGIVAVQEAFGRPQKAIGVRAGFRYSVFGPDAETPDPARLTAAEHAFLADASAWHGETEGPQEDSGLGIFSDYPIIWAGRLPFPRYACAGYDCLANKGILAAALRIPGQVAPLIVVDTHLNARTASGVDDARSFAAYRRQVDLLRVTMRSLRGAGSAVVLAGDFNVGDDPARQRYLAAALITHDGMAVMASENTCGPECRTLARVPTIAHAKTIVFYQRSLVDAGAVRSFGEDQLGQRLSDHLGVMPKFALRG